MSVQDVSTRAAATVTEVAALCQLSRSRFYELVRAGVFPQPVQNGSAKRPIYVREHDRKVSGNQANGRRTQRQDHRIQPQADQPRHPQSGHSGTGRDRHAEGIDLRPLVTGLKSLGMIDVTDAQVEKIVADLFPDGMDGQDLGEVIRAVFLELKKK